MAAILAAIDGATTFDDIKARCVMAFEGMDPAAMARLVEKAEVLGRLSGKLAVLEDLA